MITWSLVRCCSLTLVVPSCGLVFSCDKLKKCIFHTLKVVSRCRNPQLQVGGTPICKIGMKTHVNLSFSYLFFLQMISFEGKPLTAKLFNLNFHPLEIVSRWRDPQLQVSENYSDLTKWRSTVFKYCWLMSYFIFNMFERWYLMC